MKLFELRRDVDESGISGTGTVAQGIVFDNGWCALCWLTEHKSMAMYTSIDEVIHIHGHAGKTRVIKVADINMDGIGGVRHLLENRALDHCENISVEFRSGSNAAYVWGEREKFADIFKEVLLEVR